MEEKVSKFEFKWYCRGSEPTRATPGSSGYDVRADLEEVVLISPGHTEIIPTGIFAQIPQGFEIQVRSRSGLSSKHGIFVINGVGTVDSDYRGEIKVPLHNASRATFAIKPGDRIAQLVVAPVAIPENGAEFERVPARCFLEDTERSSGGFGSTGK